MPKIDHVAMTAIDIKKTSDWYVDNLNFKIKYIDETWALLTNEFGLRIALTKADQHPPHIAFEVPDLKSFPEGKIKYHRDGSAYLYIEDPSGNTIEYIYWPKELE